MPSFVRTARVMQLLVCLFLLCSTVVLPSSVSAACSPGSIGDGLTPNTFIVCGLRYKMLVDINGHKARISSLMIDGSPELLDPSQGIYSAIHNQDTGNWITSLNTLAQPTHLPIMNGNSLTISFSTSIANEVWIFVANPTNVQFQLQRTYTTAIAHVDEQGTPSINFAEDAFEHMRWPGDGGSFPVGGAMFNNNPDLRKHTPVDAVGAAWWVGSGMQLNSANRVAKLQISYTMLNRSTNKALKITGVSNHSSVTNGEATTIARDPQTHGLKLSVMTSQTGLSFKSGSSFGINTPLGKLGYSASVCDPDYNDGKSCNDVEKCNGHMRCDGTSVFSPVAVTNNQQDSVTLIFQPDDLDSYYDLGTLNGVDEKALAYAINNYGRWMIQDKKLGAAFELPIRRTGVPPYEQQWVGQLMEILQSPEAIDSFKQGLKNIATSDMIAPTGQIRCCTPGAAITEPSATTPVSYTHHRDFASGFALGVVKAYALDGNTSWLQSMQQAVEGGLDYVITQSDPDTGRRYMDPITRLLTNYKDVTDTAGGLNDYWENATGYYNGYTSIMFYEALTQWANLEANVLNNAQKALYYRNIATQLKTSLLKPIIQGGLWSWETNSFLYGNGSESGDVRFLPVQGAVLKTDILTPTLKRALVNGVESEVYQNDVDHHFMNYRTVRHYTTGMVMQNEPVYINYCNGHDGNWYGVAEGDFFAGLPATNDRSKIPVYIGNFLNRYYQDEFYGGEAWTSSLPTNPDKATQDVAATTHHDSYKACIGASWFPSHVMPAWGLYAYGYGFQPQYNELVLAPFISPSMVGSVVKYLWRRVPLTVTYNSLTSFTVTPSAALPTAMRVRWINQVPGMAYTVMRNGTPSTVTANANGDVELVLAQGSSSALTVQCSNCIVASPPPIGQPFVTGVTLSGGSQASHSGNGQIGMKFQVGANPITIMKLGRYYAPSDHHVHTLKLSDANAQVIATTSIDMRQGVADTQGFKYASLATPITLSANGVYYLYSLEVSAGEGGPNSGDGWYDCSVVSLSTSSVATIQSAVTARGETWCPGSKSYGPVNFTFIPATPTDLRAPTWDYNLDHIPDIYSVKKVAGSGKTELHILNGATNFSSFLQQKATALAATGSDASWVFGVGDYNHDQLLDLYAINKVGANGTKTQVSILAGSFNNANDFQTILLNNENTGQVATGSDGSWAWLLGDYNHDGALDLYGIQKLGAGAPLMTEVHILNGADNFHTYLQHKKTAQPPTGSDGSWVWLLGDYNLDGTLDLYGIKKAGTGSGRTEIHILNGADDFQSFLQHTVTTQAETGTDSSWEYTLADYNRDGILDLYGIKKAGTASGKVEIHVLNGADNFQSFLQHTASILDATGTGCSWNFATGQCSTP